jgi:hypothetical protein
METNMQQNWIIANRQIRNDDVVGMKKSFFAAINRLEGTAGLKTREAIYTRISNQKVLDKLGPAIVALDESFSYTPRQTPQEETPVEMTVETPSEDSPRRGLTPAQRARQIADWNLPGVLQGSATATLDESAGVSFKVDELYLNERGDTKFMGLRGHNEAGNVIFVTLDKSADEDLESVSSRHAKALRTLGANPVGRAYSGKGGMVISYATADENFTTVYEVESLQRSTKLDAVIA